MTRWLTSINQRLLVTFLIIALLPVATVGILNTLNTQRLLEGEVEDRQIEVTSLTATQITSFLNEIQLDLQRIGQVALQHPEDDYVILREQVLTQELFSEIRLLDDSGQEVAYLIDGEFVPQDELQDVHSLEIFFRPMRDEIYFSSVRIAGETPYIDVAVPIKIGDVIEGVVVAQITLEETWDVIQNQHIGERGYTLLLDKRGNVIVLPQDIADRNPSFTNTPLFQSYIAKPETVSIIRYESPISGEEVLGSAKTVAGADWILVSERPTEEAFSAVEQSQRNAYLGVIISILLASVIAFILARQITRPIRDLSQNAREIMEGNLTVHNTIQRRDEIGELATAFNSMTSQLNLLINTLEDRIADRTRDLQVAGEVATQITTVLDVQDLLARIVNLTKDAFNLYQVSIFLYDPETSILHYEAGNGEVGRILKSQDKQFKLEDQGLVPRSARTRQAVLVGDVRNSQDYYSEANLPETLSELALPIIIGETFIGVLDLQAKEVERFTENDLIVMQQLAKQIAIAVQNARLYASQVEVTEKLREADNIKSQFLASVSHELRTPLNAILNFSRFIIMGIYGEANEQQIDATNKIITSAQHLLDLINDVLDIAKIESGMMQLFVESNVNLYRELDAVENTAETLLSDKSRTVTFIKDIEENLPEVVGDKRRLRQILLNLVSNACKFTEKGSITLSVKQQGDTIQFSVVDTGPGIAEDKLDIIFEPFQQTETGVKHAGGTGLGLPISRKLAEAHGGKLWVATTEGKGSSFFVEIPVRSAELLKQLE